MPMKPHVSQKSLGCWGAWAASLLVLGCGNRGAHNIEAQEPRPGQAISQPAGAAPRPDLNGQRIGNPTTRAIYLVDGGYRRHIPNPATYDNLFRDWDGVVWDPNFSAIPEGTPLSDGATLARTSGTAPVYLISNGVKRWITAPAVMDRYNLSWERVVEVSPPVILDSIPSGTSIE